MSTAVRIRQGFGVVWIGLSVLTAVLLVWWWSVITLGGVGFGGWAPFAMPILFGLRSVARGSWAPALTGLALGITLSGATGRGIVFTLVAIAGILIEFLTESGRLRAAWWVLAGFAIGLAALTIGLALA